MKKTLLLAIVALFAMAPISTTVNNTADAQRVKSLREVRNQQRSRSSRSQNSYCQFSWLSNRYVDSSDLYGMSGSDLRILRNAIYAMHGYKFKSADLRNYFKQFSWYTPRYADVSSQLNKYEKYNIQFILSYE